jgi:hypothetical protein
MLHQRPVPYDPTKVFNRTPIIQWYMSGPPARYTPLNLGEAADRWRHYVTVNFARPPTPGVPIVVVKA